MLTLILTDALIDDSVESQRIAKEKYLQYSKPNIIPTTIIKTYVRDNIRYWEERTRNGILVSITSREITHGAGV